MAATHGAAAAQKAQNTKNTIRPLLAWRGIANKGQQKSNDHAYFRSELDRGRLEIGPPELFRRPGVVLQPAQASSVRVSPAKCYNQMQVSCTGSVLSADTSKRTYSKDGVIYLRL